MVPSVRSAAFALVAAGLLAGCADRSLYYWGNYEDTVLLYGEALEGADRSKQLELLDKDVARAAQKGKPLPPGFHAHYGQLLLETGDLAGAQDQFRIERERFPESAAFMDWVLTRLEAQP